MPRHLGNGKKSTGDQKLLDLDEIRHWKETDLHLNERGPKRDDSLPPVQLQIGKPSLLSSKRPTIPNPECALLETVLVHRKLRYD